MPLGWARIALTGRLVENHVGKQLDRITAEECRNNLPALALNGVLENGLAVLEEAAHLQEPFFAQWLSLLAFRQPQIGPVTRGIFIIDEFLNRLAQFNQLVRAEERAVIEIALLAEGVDLVRSNRRIVGF